MAINEIFPNPTVKQVIFQIRFPNLFSIENKIGTFQEKIIEKFPESSLLFRRKFILADIGPRGKLEDIQKDIDMGEATKIWQFKSDKDIQLNILSDSLDITCSHHKTYNLGTGDKFRDAIEYVVNQFLSVIPLPTIARIGLRYIDECPIQSKTNSEFKNWYNTAYPLDRFSIEDAVEMVFKTVIKRGAYYIRYIESLRQTKDTGQYKLILDFDGSATKINSEDIYKLQMIFID